MAGSVNLDQTMCNDCRHQDRKSFAVPTCAHPKAYRPNGCQQACVIAAVKCAGRHWEAK